MSAELSSVITPSLLNIISIIYGVLAIKMVYDVWKNRRSLFDDTVTPEDAKLAQGMAFYLLWPPIVLLHEGGHALLASLFHASNIRLHFYGYWGEITYDPGPTARQNWWVALAGNLVNYVLGLVLPLCALRVRSLIWRIILYSVASNQWFVVLLWYPGLCLTGAFQGDFNIIYGQSYWWAGSVVVAAVNVVSLAAYGWVNYTDNGKRWLQTRLWRAGTRPAAR